MLATELALCSSWKYSQCVLLDELLKELKWPVQILFNDASSSTQVTWRHVGSDYGYVQQSGKDWRENRRGLI
jgi:hypothetical protein